MKSKMQLRQQLEAGMKVFLAEGKQIQKVDTIKLKSKRQPKEQMVEIEIEHLPPSLRMKHFGE